MIAEDMFTPDQKALYDLMSDISEDCFFAVWITGNEYGVWDAINGNARGYEQASAEQLQKCRELSNLINGWVIWRDDQDDPDMPLEEWGPYFIGMDEWIAMKHTYDEATIALFAKKSQ